MQKNEDKFWADLLVGSNPGWAVSMANSWGDGSSHHPHLSANIYAYDTSSGWSGTCAVTPGDFLHAADILGGSLIMRDAAVCYAHRELVRASDGNATTSVAATRRAMVLNMYYLAQSQALKVVRVRFGSVHGHWMSLLYRFKKGQTMIRPSFRSDVIGTNPMSKQMIAQWAYEVLQEDQNTQDSGVDRQLRAGNELVFAASSEMRKRTHDR